MMENTIRTCSHKFRNGNVVVNTTPHPLTFLDGDEIVVIPSDASLLVNASVSEERINSYIVVSSFSGNEQGQGIVDAIKDEFKDERLFIVGSILAANAYPDVVGMCPAPGFERVAPAEKKMSCEKFNAGNIFPSEWRD